MSHLFTDYLQNVSIVKCEHITKLLSVVLWLTMICIIILYEICEVFIINTNVDAL